MNDVLKEVINKNGKVYQMIIAMEEMSELTKELSKCIRGANNRDQIIEEVADVYIMLMQIEMIHNISKTELFNMMNTKLDRLKERMDHESV